MVFLLNPEGTRSRKVYFFERVQKIRIPSSKKPSKWGGKIFTSENSSFQPTIHLCLYLHKKRNKSNEQRTEGCCFHGELATIRRRKGGINYQACTFLIIDITIWKWFNSRYNTRTITTKLLSRINNDCQTSTRHLMTWYKLRNKLCHLNQVPRGWKSTTNAWTCEMITITNQSLAMKYYPVQLISKLNMCFTWTKKPK